MKEAAAWTNDTHPDEEGEEPLTGDSARQPINEPIPDDIAADNKACSKANHIIREGAPHAHQQAAKILKSQGLVDVKQQPEVVELVRSIFPQVQQQIPRPPPTATIVQIGDTLELQMLKQLRRLRGKAPGPSGWTADALCQLAEDQDVRQGMLALVGAIMNNIVPPNLRFYLVARDLCLVPKHPVPRPIAKGDVFVKLASKIAYQRVSLKVKKYLSTRNVSLGLSGGCEFVVHMLNATLKHNDNGDIHCKADVRHCFQNLPRAKVLQHLFTIDEFSDIFHLLHFLYGDESAMLLHMGRDKSAAVIWSRQGMAQGCVLGSMLCSVYVTDKHYTPAQQAALRAHGGGAKLLAVGITDEVNFVGPQQLVLTALETLVRSTQEDGLELGTIALGALLRPTQELPATVVQFAATRPEFNIKLYRHSTITAGVCIYADSDQGRQEFAAWEQKIVDKSAQFFRRLASPQLRFESAQSIARQCASLKMTYYTRCLQPADSLALATKFDDKLTELLQHRVGVTDQQLQKEQWIRALFFLPLRHGGVGLTSAVNTRHAAFLAAVLNGLDPLQQLGVDASGLKAQALQALEKCIEQATKNSQLSELLLKASGTEDPIDTLLNELRSKD